MKPATVSLNQGEHWYKASPLSVFIQLGDFLDVAENIQSKTELSECTQHLKIMFSVVLSRCSVLLLMRLIEFSHCSNYLYLFMFGFLFLMVKGCALYKRWRSSVLGDLPICISFRLFLFTNDVLCFTNLLEFSFWRSCVMHLSLYDRNCSKAGFLI